LDCFGNLGFGVGQLYVPQFFPPTSKAKVEALIADVKATFRSRMERADWMSPTTKVEALQKHDSYQIKIGYPDNARDYSGVEIRIDDLVGNVRRAAEWDWRFHVDRLNGPVDRSEWLITPQTNDAYNGSLRDVVVPAGVLQPPMFDPAADPAINYARSGRILAKAAIDRFTDTTLLNTRTLGEPNLPLTRTISLPDEDWLRWKKVGKFKMSALKKLLVSAAPCIIGHVFHTEMTHSAIHRQGGWCDQDIRRNDAE
jgi:Peptidase family M13